jgi:hypothetical protein
MAYNITLADSIHKSNPVYDFQISTTFNIYVKVYGHEMETSFLRILK